MSVVKSNFVTVDSFLLSMWACLRQTLIHKLKHVKSSDQAVWIKTEDHITDLLNDDQMLTIENTDQTIKKYETYVVRVIDTNTTVLLVGAFNDDNPEMVTLQDQLAEMKALMIDVVNCSYKFIHELFDEEKSGELILELARKDPAPDWDTPQLVPSKFDRALFDQLPKLAEPPLLPTK